VIVMNRLPGFLRLHLAALRGLLVLTVLTGIIYPLVLLGAAQAAFRNQANGSLVRADGRVAGSSLLCQEFVTARGAPLPQYFQPRPSAATSGDASDYGCDPRYSAASSLGPDNPDLVTLIRQRQKQIAASDHVAVPAIPPDAVTASGSGLDPYISPKYAYLQADRVASARNIPAAAVRSLIAAQVQGRTLGFLGEPRVNVLALNIALDPRYPARG
jgi:potassium-transporting ATPase KdpC subunit